MALPLNLPEPSSRIVNIYWYQILTLNQAAEDSIAAIDGIEFLSNLILPLDISRLSPAGCISEFGYSASCAVTMLVTGTTLSSLRLSPVQRKHPILALLVGLGKTLPGTYGLFEKVIAFLIKSPYAAAATVSSCCDGSTCSSELDRVPCQITTLRRYSSLSFLNLPSIVDNTPKLSCAHLVTPKAKDWLPQEAQAEVVPSQGIDEWKATISATRPRRRTSPLAITPGRRTTMWYLSILAIDIRGSNLFHCVHRKPVPLTVLYTRVTPRSGGDGTASLSYGTTVTWSGTRVSVPRRRAQHYSTIALEDSTATVVTMDRSRVVTVPHPKPLAERRECDSGHAEDFFGLVTAASLVDDNALSSRKRYFSDAPHSTVAFGLALPSGSTSVRLVAARQPPRLQAQIGPEAVRVVFASPIANGEVVIHGTESQAPGLSIPGSDPINGLAETSNQDFATLFAEFLNGRSVDPLLTQQFEHNIMFSLPAQEILRSEPQPRLLTSSPVTRDTINDTTEEAMLTHPLQSIIQQQQNQLEQLRQQLARSDQRCAYYHEKSATFKALYSHQRALAEHIMASLVAGSCTRAIQLNFIVVCDLSI
ncbi:hypothetical protein BKA70DRAFT_1223598 [Coprinopsis sp. MPI-PUGE-AT-0042]|nr:hypothetical protein BKA70DRAFT_1223598 [Coprinopsis sp. MPI-PUGE-AT-0042]